ncbi:MAG: hypothetical protein WBM47_02885, partial [Polyangiales bacterium]
MRAGQQLEVFSAAFGLAASAALHIAAFAYIASATAHFDFDFALTLPAEVEFGVADGMEFAAAPSQARTEAGGAIDDRPKAEPTDAVIIDGGVPDTDTDADEDTDADADIDAETGAGTDAVSAPALEGPSRLPPGAQLALR